VGASGRLPSRAGMTSTGRRRGMNHTGNANGGAAMHVDLDRAVGYLVADVRGLVVGWVEAPRYSRVERTADALSVRTGVLRRRRRIVRAGGSAAAHARTPGVGL